MHFYIFAISYSRKCLHTIFIRIDIINNFINSTGLEVTPKQGWTDVARFTNHGIPALNFGPGDPLLAHTSDEFVIKNEILESYEILSKFLESAT